MQLVLTRPASASIEIFTVASIQPTGRAARGLGNAIGALTDPHHQEPDAQPGVAPEQGCSMNHRPVSARINPEAGMEVLSKAEVSRPTAATTGDLCALFRRCTLAVLTTGIESDDARAVLARHPDFDARGPAGPRRQTDLINAPTVLRRRRDHSRYPPAAVRRTARHSLRRERDQDPGQSERARRHHQRGLRHPAQCRHPCGRSSPNMVVCWGGHSIGRTEYQYTKKVGYELGLRGMDICTGCGPGR